MKLSFVCAILLCSVSPVYAGQAPGAAGSPDIAISHKDRFYTSDQFSNTVSVIDPADNKLLGVIRLGDPTPANLSPLYKGQLLVHGMGFSPDHRTLAVISIGSNSVTFIDTATNAIKHVTYVGRSPHEEFFTPDGKEVWVSVRGENYIAVLDGQTYRENSRIEVPNGPGMTIFSPDGKYGYVCSRDSCYSHSHQTDCWPGEAGKSILSRHHDTDYFVQPRSGAGSPGGGHRLGAEKAVHSCTSNASGRRRQTGAPCKLHDESGGRCHCEFYRSDPSGGRGLDTRNSALLSHRTRI